MKGLQVIDACKKASVSCIGQLDNCVQYVCTHNTTFLYGVILLLVSLTYLKSAIHEFIVSLSYKTPDTSNLDTRSVSSL